jgi:hypothetical protein
MIRPAVYRGWATTAARLTEWLEALKLLPLRV